MQRPQNTLHIRDRLLTGLDKENNVVNPAIVAEVLSQLDTIQITKEELEATRLGRHINELRKRTDNNQIKARAKSLIKKWRDTFVQQQQNGGAPPQAPTVQAQAPAVVAKTSGEPPPGGGGGNLTNGHRHHHKQAAASLPRATSSSLPSSTSTSPGLSRPATPKSSPPFNGPVKNGAAAAAAATAAPPVNGLKRHRQEVEDDRNSDVDVVEVDDEDHVVQVAPPAAKKQRVNGYNHHSHPSAPQPPSNCDSSNKLNSVISESVRPTPGRRKTRSQQRTAPSLNEQTDTLLQQMQVAQGVRAGQRVKTTQELVQELAMKRSTSPGMPPSAAAAAAAATASKSTSIVEETQEQLMNRYFESQNGKRDPSPPTSLGVPSPPSEPTTSSAVAGGSSANRPETVEDVMARLPPVDVAAVLAEMAKEAEMEPDSDDDVEMEGLIPVKKPEPLAVTDELVDRLHEGQTESFNGNFAHDGDFKEWHEVVTKTTLGGDLIHILPYSVID